MSQWSNNIASGGRWQILLSYFNLTLSLVIRDVQTRYRRTMLGPLWAFIPVILSTLMLSFLSGLLDASTDGVPRLVFVVSATVPWTFFQSSLTRIPNGFLSNGSIMRKMPVPRQIFPLTVLLTTLFDYCLSFGVLVIVLQLFQIPITAEWLWLLPLLLMTSLMAWAIGLGLSAFSIYRRDMLYVIQFVMQAWLFITPVMYSKSELESRFQVVNTLNPMVPIIDGFREVLVFGRPPDVPHLALSMGIICLVMLFTVPIFTLMSRYFTDVL